MPRQHAVITKMMEASKCEKNTAIKSTVNAWVKEFLEADKFLIDKLFIVQIAAAEGWNLANKVNFLESG